jgi:hypothetical protein
MPGNHLSMGLPVFAGILVILLASGCSGRGSDQEAQANSAGAPTAAPAGSGGASARATGGSAARGGSGSPGTAARGGTNVGQPATSLAGSQAVAGTAAAGATASTGTAGTSGSSSQPMTTNAPCMIPDDAMVTGTARHVTVDAAQTAGRIRSLQGAHYNPGVADGALSKTYRNIGVDMIRTHDIGSGTGNAADMDGTGANIIFPNLSADPMSASSYNFAPTDAVIKNIRDAGAEVYFRVGRSNSNVPTVPTDFDNYAKAVKQVVLHYNQGWANGFNYGIKYFEIWNEPDFDPFWSGTPEQYRQLYQKIALAIREAGPDAIIGGPTSATFSDQDGLRATFLKFVKDNALPLDFYSFHKYTNGTNDPYEFARMAMSYREELDKFGLTKTEVINSEYETSLNGDVVLGGDAGRAGFMAQSLIYMQNAGVARAFVYGRVAATPTKENLAFGAVSKLNATPIKLCTKTQAGEDNGFAVLAGRNEDEAKPMLQVVIASYQVSKSLMGPRAEGDVAMVPGVGTIELLPRRTIDYPDTDGYQLSIHGIPDAWGDVTVQQYRIDASNNFTVINTAMVKAADRPQGVLTFSGTSWVRARADPQNDPKGAPQGVDLIVVNSAASAASGS